MIAIASIGVMNALVAMVIFIRSRSSNRLMNQALALLSLLIAIRIGKVIAQTSDLYLIKALYFNLMHGAYLLLGPALILFLKAQVVQKFKPGRRDLIHIIPASLLLLLATVLRSSLEEGQWLNIYQLILLLPVPYVVFAGRLILKSPYKTKVCPWAILGLVALVILFNTAYFLFEFPFYLVTTCLVLAFALVLLLRFVEFRTSLVFKSVVNPSESEIMQFEVFEIYIHEHYHSFDLSMNTVSDSLGIPKHSLSRIINHQSGKSFSEYVNALRISKASELLSKEPQLKITAIAYEVGFRSISSFNTTFRSHTDMTPSSYREKFT